MGLGASECCWPWSSPWLHLWLATVNTASASSSSSSLSPHKQVPPPDFLISVALTSFSTSHYREPPLSPPLLSRAHLQLVALPCGFDLLRPWLVLPDLLLSSPYGLHSGTDPYSQPSFLGLCWTLLIPTPSSSTSLKPKPALPTLLPRGNTPSNQGGNPYVCKCRLNQKSSYRGA